MQNAIEPAFCLPSKRKLNDTFFHGLETYKFALKTIKILEKKNIFEGISFLVNWSVVLVHGSAYTTAYQIIAAMLYSVPPSPPIKIFTIGFYGLTDSYSLIKQGWIIKIEVYN